MNMNQDESTKLWDNNADQWHRLFGENDLNRRDLLDPIILQVLGDAKGRQILDAGYRDRYLIRKLARLGASITAVDLSERLLEFAIEEQNKKVGHYFKKGPFLCSWGPRCGMVSFDGDYSPWLGYNLDAPEFIQGNSHEISCQLI